MRSRTGVLTCLAACSNWQAIRLLKAFIDLIIKAGEQGKHTQTSNQVLQAIVESIGEPFGHTFQVISLNEIKKRFYKLNIDIQKVVKGHR